MAKVANISSLAALISMLLAPLYIWLLWPSPELDRDAGADHAGADLAPPQQHPEPAQGSEGGISDGRSLRTRSDDRPLDTSAPGASACIGQRGRMPNPGLPSC